MAEDGFEDLRADWAAQSGPPPASLARYVRRRTLRQYFDVIMELLSAVFVTVFMSRVVWLKPTGTNVALATGTYILLAVWAVQLFALRRGVWKALGDDARAYLKLSLERTIAEQKWYRFTLRCLPWMAVFIAVIAPLRLWEYAPIYRAQPWRAVVGFGGVYLILGGLWWFTRRKLRSLAEIASRLTQSLAALEDPAAGPPGA